MVRVKERTLAEEHPDRLESQYALAKAYQADGQINKAVNMLKHVAEVKERTRPRKHPHRLESQHLLAIAKKAYKEKQSHR